MTSWDKVEKDVESGPFGLFKWFAIGVLGLVVLFGGINFFAKPLEVARDRVILENSFQYKAGMEAQGAIFEAQLAELDAQIAQATTSAERENLQRQKSVINARIRAIQIQQQ
jgi:hypothetical protein